MHYTVLTGILVIILTAFEGFPQQHSDSDTGIVITVDKRITELLNRSIELNKENQTIPGFRVQLFESPGRAAVFSAQGDFLKLYSDVPTYIVYQQPSFKLRAGDFESRLDAMKLWNAVRDKFPSSFVIQDEIQITPPEKTVNDD